MRNDAETHPVISGNDIFWYGYHRLEVRILGSILQLVVYISKRAYFIEKIISIKSSFT